MRPINSMIEFKQIIGRGTRLYDGKDYFTIYDFVKAHLHFSDPEWDGEPEEEALRPNAANARACAKCPSRSRAPSVAKLPASARRSPARMRPTPCHCERQDARHKVKLADGKARNIQHMMATTFWHPDGTPMSAQQFLELLFGKLPEFFKDEAELRALWSAPTPARSSWHGLAEKGFGAEQMAEMQRIIDAENSDLFDVLAYVAYAIADAHPRRACRHCQSRDQRPLQRQAASLPRFRPRPLR